MYGWVSGRSDRIRAMDGSVTMRWFKPYLGKPAFSFLSGIAAELSGTGLRRGDGCRSLGKGLPGCAAG